MNNFFKSTTFKVLIIVAAVLLSASILATVTSTSTSPLTNVIEFITSPLQNAAAYISAKWDGMTGGFISSKSYQDRVVELEQQVADYQKQLVDYEKTKKQLESYYLLNIVLNSNEFSAIIITKPFFGIINSQS